MEKNGFYIEAKYPGKRRARNQPLLFGCFEKCLLGSNFFFKEFIFQSLVEHHLEKKGNAMVWCLGTEWDCSDLKYCCATYY